MFLLLFIGLRHKVGGDWGNYLSWLKSIESRGLNISVKRILIRDFAYDFLNWISVKFGWGIYGVNLICAFIYLLGLFKFVSILPRKYDALLVAYPYLTMIVAMSYTRQATALGLIFLSYYFFAHERYKSSYTSSILAMFFHKSSVIGLIFIFLIHPKEKRSKIFSSLLFILIMFFIFVFAYNEIILRFYKFYVERQMISEGGRLRGLMNFIPALFFLLTAKHWKKNLSNREYKLWHCMTWIVIFFSLL